MAPHVGDPDQGLGLLQSPHARPGAAGRDLFADSATPAAISPIIMAEAVRLVLAGGGVLIPARRREPEVDARTALLRSLGLATAPPKEGGRT